LSRLWQHTVNASSHMIRTPKSTLLLHSAAGMADNDR
jgi:hypothetical protein